MNNIELLHRIMFLSKNLSQTGISQGQIKVMYFLKMQDNISTKELASILDIKVPSLNEVLNKLEKKELIFKEPSDEDKRVLVIKLTEKGRAYKFKAPENLDLFDCLDENERENFEKTILKLNNEIHNRFKEENPEKYQMIMEKRNKKYPDCRKFNFDDIFEK